MCVRVFEGPVLGLQCGLSMRLTLCMYSRTWWSTDVFTDLLLAADIHAHLCGCMKVCV